jgi:hypothetical protein
MWIDLYFPFGGSLHIYIEASVVFDATVVAALLALLGTVFTAVMTYLTYRNKENR